MPFADNGNPAHTAALAQEASLKKISLPTVETFEPEALCAAASAYAILVRKVQEAEKTVARIKAEQLERDVRLDIVNALLGATPGDIIDVWCADHTTGLTGTVETMEVPGYWIDEYELRTAVVGDATELRTVVYYERSWNIAPSGTLHPGHGDMHFSESLTDAGVAYNLAMEPGHIKWHPIWRYGILLTDGWGDVCTVQLNSIHARGLPRSLSEEERDPMNINDFNDTDILTNVPISYPPCNGAVFKINDEVLVLFEGQQRQLPKVIGFRREPKACPKTWEQLR